MVKHILLLGDDKNRMKEAEEMLQEFTQNAGWECDIRSLSTAEMCVPCEEDGSAKGKEYLTIFSQGMIIRINTADIRHVESHNHKVHIYTEENIYIVYEKLSDVLGRLPAEFVQCHKSFVVNMDYVAAIDGKEVILEEGKRIAISRTYHNQMRERLKSGGGG